MKYLPQVVREARYHIGMDAPAYYFMGQIEQESRCDEGATSFDGGMGLGQFTEQTAEWIHEREQALKDIPMNPYDPRWSIRAMILYDYWLYGKTDCKGWYYAFRAYNGGLGNINREIRAAGSCDEKEVERCCKRYSIRLKNGLLNFCKVNITYPYLIFLKAEKYR